MDAARVTSRMVPPQEQPIAEGIQQRSLWQIVKPGKSSLLFYLATPPLSALPTPRTRGAKSEIAASERGDSGSASHRSFLLLERFCSGISVRGRSFLLFLS